MRGLVDWGIRGTCPWQDIALGRISRTPAVEETISKGGGGGGSSVVSTARAPHEERTWSVGRAQGMASTSGARPLVVPLTSAKGQLVVIEPGKETKGILEDLAKESLRAAVDMQAWMEALSPLGRAVSDSLLDGSGAVLLRGLPVEPEGAAYAASQAMSQLLGTLIPQSADLRESIGRVEAVKDPAVDAEYRGYRNAREQKLHTDTPAPWVDVDAVAMVCVRQARRGGASRIASADAIVQRLNPQAVQTLSNGVPYACRDEWVEEWGGLGPSATAPLLSFDAKGRRTLAYAVILRKNVEHAGASPQVMAALDELETVANSEDTFWRVRLAPGEGLVLDNRRWLHARDAFEDDEAGVHEETDGALPSVKAGDKAAPTSAPDGDGTGEGPPQSRLVLRVWIRLSRAMIGEDGSGKAPVH